MKSPSGAPARHLGRARRRRKKKKTKTRRSKEEQEKTKEKQDFYLVIGSPGRVMPCHGRSCLAGNS
jgi:hypothetical protein